jgi:ribosomal protein S12 methylthiotransferase accessory factor
MRIPVMSDLEIKIRFQGNKKVNAEFKEFTVATDQCAKTGGDGTAPEPYDLFLASIGTCAGYYVLAFCEKRGIPLEGITLTQRQEFTDPGHVLSKVCLEINVPPDFPDKYLGAVEKAAASCGVKKAVAAGPEFVIETKKEA